MTPVIEIIGWAAVAAMSGGAVSGPLNTFNNWFAVGVDTGHSCWNRVSGEAGVYGGPHEFDLDPLCNYRIKKKPVDGQAYDWVLERI